MDNQEVKERADQFTRALKNADQNLLASLLVVGNDQELSEIKNMLASNEWILPYVCKLGFFDILQTICGFNVMNINTSYEGKTGLQYACIKGYVDIVKWLLDNGASLNKNLWREDSEFYLATLNGHKDIIDNLLTKQLEVAPDISVCYCLMYAACCGGHIDLVKMWFSPSIDVKETIAFTTDLRNCEHKYPLFAACEGEHFDVATFLINECGAAITSDICHYFPKFTTELVKSLFLISDTKHQQNFIMADSNVECILPCWFTNEKSRMKTKFRVSIDEKEDANEDDEALFEIMIDVKKNRLRELPEEVLFALRELVLLDASYNPLRTISFSNPVDRSIITSNQLKSVNFSHCELESVSNYIFDLPCLEQLNLSYNKLTCLGSNEENITTRTTNWKCTRLRSLDVSHNLLTTVSTGIQACTQIISLNASYNQLSAACTPWQCPMKSLNLSNNKLAAFAPSADQFWKQTLNHLYLHCNQLNELPESIVKMRHLVDLDMSSNNIQQMPPPNLWCCPLNFLNLNDNRLGACNPKTPFQRTISLNISPVVKLEFPKACLASTLMELYLANNDLKTVPIGICDLEVLGLLDLSDNVKINELPVEMGKLKKLTNLKLVGITVKDKELQNLISSLEDITKHVYACDVIKYLEKKYRSCVHPDILKIVVLGCKNKNGPCIVQKLTNSKVNDPIDHKNLTVARMTPKQKKSLTYEIWEIPDTKVTSAILPCFLTINSLYIIVHDASYSGADLHSVSETVSSIQACVFRPKIIVVCTYSKSIEKSIREKLEKEIMQKSKCGFPKTKFISITLAAKENVDSLLQEIYSAWETMGDAIYEKYIKLQQRVVPEKFIQVVNIMKKLQLNICRMDEFLLAIGCSRKDLEDGIDENLKMHEFLLQVGAMLHYNIHMDELSDCVILNPTWLFKVFSKFLKSLTNENKIKIAQISIGDARAKFKEELPIGDYDYFPAFLKLLENFNIGIRMVGSANKKDEVSLLVPSLLPKQPPQFQIDKHRDACRAARLYCLPAVSPSLWSHVISQLILAFERFSTSKWKLGEHRSTAGATIDRTKSFMMGCVSLKGLSIFNKNIQYWRTGIMMHYDQGHVVVEQITYTHGSVKPEPGILVTVQTTGTSKSNSNIEQPSVNTKKLSVMGIITDELEEILELFDPKFRDPTEMQVRHVYALCPLCNNIKYGSGCINLEAIHFKVRECAQALLSRDTMTCTKGETMLAHLVPEFLFLELPPELHLETKDIELIDVKLGHGIAGSVTKGTYKGMDIAVKVFHNSVVSKCSVASNDESACHSSSYMDNADRESFLKRQKEDELETEQIKISNAFTDVRREVGILSKLRHEFVVKFIGLCVRPQLLLVLELAPLGSLRHELDKRTINLFNELKNPDTAITEMIFSKDLTYKIILQIGSGLSYLHKHGVIYRDLKPDNILLFSLSPDDRVNIKLSDYGISKFVTAQGVMGLLGTPGYIAPEVVANQPYTEQADIYSYAIVMLEVLTGIPPSEKLQLVHNLSAVDDNKIAPSHIKGRKIHTCFPYLQNLIEECWSFSMDERPMAKKVVKRMKSDQFLLLCDSVFLDCSSETLVVTCIYSCQTFGRWNIWISESGNSNHRYFSVYDVTSCTFTIYRQQCHGPQVLDMTKIGSRIWLVCKDCNNLQVIVRGTQSKFEVCHGVSLEVMATTILKHSIGATEESDSLLLVGLEDGSVAVYQFKTHHKKSVTKFTTIDLNRDTPVTSMCTINTNIVAIACGMSVYLLHVSSPDFSTANVTGARTTTPKIVNDSSISLRNVLCSYDPIRCMVFEGNSVWCSMEFSSCLVKVDIINKKIDQVINLKWKSARDIIKFKEIKLGSNTNCSERNSDDYSPLVVGQLRPRLRRDANSYPELSTQGLPNVSPTKPRFSQSIAVTVTSIALSVDNLVLGTSCGGLVLLPLIYKNQSDKSGSLPSLPFHLPMMRHPTNFKYHRPRSKSYLAFNPVQTQSSTGLIQALVLADDKLVSLHSAQVQNLRNRLKSNNVGNKREGSVFTGQLSEDLNSQAQNESNPFNVSENTDSYAYGLESPQQFNATFEDTMQYNIADIAIWDNLSRKRLKVVRSYSHERVGCLGMCCHAPDWD